MEDLLSDHSSKVSSFKGKIIESKQKKLLAVSLFQNKDQNGRIHKKRCFYSERFDPCSHICVEGLTFVEYGSKSVILHVKFVLFRKVIEQTE